MAQTHHKFNIRVPLTTAQKGEAEAIRQARYDLERREEALVKEIATNSRVEAARSIVEDGYGTSQGVAHFKGIIHGMAEFTIAFTTISAAEPVRPSRTYVNIDPSTANLLLNGKLLSHGEKRALLLAVAPGLADVLEAKPDTEDHDFAEVEIKKEA